MIDMQAVAAAFVAASFHHTWFNSNLPAHVFKLLSKWGWIKPMPEEVEDFDQWFTWINVTETINPKMAELLTCPRCLQWHIAVWVSWITTFFDGQYDTVLFKISASVMLCIVITK